MDDQVVQKVKECAVDYLGVRMDDIVSVSEMFRDDTSQGFEVRIQGNKPQRQPEAFFHRSVDGLNRHTAVSKQLEPVGRRSSWPLSSISAWRAHAL